MEKKIATQVQEVQRVPVRINQRRKMPRPIVTKLTKIEDKEKLLKATRETWQITYKGTPIRITADFNNFSLSLIFASLIFMCLSMFLLGFILPETL